MRTVRAKFYPLFVLLLTTIMLAGCVMVDSAATTATVEQVPTNATLAKIYAEGYFTYGLEAQYRPFEFRDENDEIIGYDIDIANEIGARMGVEARAVDTSWGAVIQSLYDGKFDFILGGMTANSDRFQRVDFSVPYMDGSSGLLVREGEGILARADLDGKIVGAGEGTPSIAQLEDTAVELSISYNEDIRTYDDDAAAYEALKTNRIDAYASSIVSLLDWASQNPGYEVIPFTSENWASEYTAAAFRKEDQTFRAVINGLMIAMKEDGTLAELQEKWFGQSFDLPNVPPTWE